MELNALRAALRGISACRELTTAAVMSNAAALLDALYQKKGEEALSVYTAPVLYPAAGGLRGAGRLAVGSPALH